ncbi:MAG: metallophosphoesterase family protein, partial [Terriglobia bacterium]
MTRIALFGGIYSNYRALEVALRDVEERSVDAVYCLGDLGAFGPYPDRVYPLLRQGGVECIQGNYDNSLAGGLADCQCGYTDPRDNYFARLSYSYTFQNTSEGHKAWLRTLPLTRRLLLGDRRVLLCHG